MPADGRWQMGFNSAFKGLRNILFVYIVNLLEKYNNIYTYIYDAILLRNNDFTLLHS